MISKTFGVIPMADEIDFPSEGYEIECRGYDLEQITRCINQGIDSHLQAIYFDQFQGSYGRTGIRIVDAESLLILVRRLTELESENADQLASAIMETVGIEWV